VFEAVAAQNQIPLGRENVPATGSNSFLRNPVLNASQNSSPYRVPVGHNTESQYLMDERPRFNYNTYMQNLQ
jgi:hypothetical protein